MNSNILVALFVTFVLSAAVGSGQSAKPLTLEVVDAKGRPVQAVIQLASRGFHEALVEAKRWETKGEFRFPEMDLADGDEGRRMFLTNLVAWAEGHLFSAQNLEKLAAQPRWQLIRQQSLATQLQFTVKVVEAAGRQKITVKVKNPTDQPIEISPQGWLLTSNRYRVLLDPIVPTHQLKVAANSEVQMELDWSDVLRRALWVPRQAGPATGTLVLPSHPEDDHTHWQLELGQIHSSIVGLRQPEVVWDLMRAVEAKLVFDKDEYFVGENILAHVMLTNTEAEPVTIELGGDYRGSPRALRFKVEVTDQQGRAMVDPTPKPMCMGGLGGSQELKPNTPYWLSIPLLRYRELPAAGLYQVKVFHDLGWESCPSWDCTAGNTIPPSPRLAPVLTGAVRVKVPDARQALEVIQSQIDLPPNNGHSWGQRHQPFADFSLMRHPIFLPGLRQWVLREGNEHPAVPRGPDNSRPAKPHPSANPVAAIGGIRSQEATRVLFELLNHKNASVAHAALLQLERRLPYPYLEERKDWGMYGERLLLAQTTWDPQLRKPLVEFALELVRTGEGPRKNFDGSTPEIRRDHQIHGARILQAVVRREDYPALHAQLDDVLRAFLDVSNEQHNYPRPSNLTSPYLDALYYAACDGQTLLAGRPHGEPVGEAKSKLPQPLDDLTTARLVKLYPDVRPADWTRRLRKGLTSDVPWVRATLMTAIVPHDAASNDEQIRQLVVDNLRHSSDAVLAEALHVAVRCPHRDYLPNLRILKASTDNTFLEGEAEHAITLCEKQ